MVKKVIQYIGIFAIVFSLLLTVLLATMKIPREAIENNLIKSAEYFRNRNMVEKIQRNREYTYLHLWSEAVLLNIIYCVDTDNVLESAMLDRYYESRSANTNKDYISLIENYEEPNTQYLRYWHGSMAILRPCLVLLSIQQIFILNYIIINILFLILLIILLKKSKKLALIFVISMGAIAFPIVGISLLYSWCFYIMMITSIVAILIEKKGNNALYKLFFVTGIITCFLDFLTTEIITVFVPILFVIFIRKEENKTFNLKDSLIFVTKASIIWLLGYISMWGAKWLLASIVLKINAMDYVFDNLKLRINGVDSLMPPERMYLQVIPRNFFSLYPICNFKNIKKWASILAVLAIIFVISIDWKNIRKNKFALLMMLIAIIPYIRYLVLANHSYKHFFFTYREQIISIIAISMVYVDCFNKKLWLKKMGAKE